MPEKPSRYCPRCAGIALVETSFVDETVDVCPSCHGVYLDRGEMRDLLELVNDFVDVHLNEAEIENIPAAERDFKPDCPSCSQTLEPHQVSQVWIDRCPDCQGIWLDQGEISALRATQLLIRGNLNLFLRLGQ